MVARGIVNERLESTGVVSARGVAKEAWTPLAVLLSPVVLLKSV